MKYGIEVGQIYLAADGGRCGHLVTDVTTFEHCDDVVTTPFNASKWGKPGNRIDAFKLAMVRYAIAEEAPYWMPNAQVTGRVMPENARQNILLYPLTLFDYALQ